MDDDKLRRNTGSHFALHFIYISYTLLVDVVVVLNGFVVLLCSGIGMQYAND